VEARPAQQQEEYEAEHRFYYNGLPRIGHGPAVSHAVADDVGGPARTGGRADHPLGGGDSGALWPGDRTPPGLVVSGARRIVGRAGSGFASPLRTHAPESARGPAVLVRQ